MVSVEQMLSLIKGQVHSVVPEAEVHLFGSRVVGNPTEESDWNILVLTKIKYPKATKWQIYDKLIPIAVEFCTFINLVMVQQDEWKSSPAYYSLRLYIGDNLVAA